MHYLVVETVDMEQVIIYSKNHSNSNPERPDVGALNKSMEILKRIHILYVDYCLKFQKAYEKQ